MDLTQPAHAISDALARGELTAETLMAETLSRIEADNGWANAVVSLADPDSLMHAARMADRAPRKGWLHGMPVAVKDLANAKGFRTSMGSPAMPDHLAGASDLHIRRMQDAGAIVIGKTNTPEFGLGSHTFNPVFGATQNALLPGKSAGGSSGGAAVALALGMTTVADGSDMMGSLRNPAGWNGVYGLRPSWGRVPSEPVGEMFLHQLSTNGPMGRCPRDVAMLLDTQSGQDPRQPHGFDADLCAPLIAADIKGRRIGWLADWGGALPMEEGVLSHCAEQVARFEALGCDVEAIDAPFDAALLWESWTTLRSWAVASSLGQLFEQNRDALKPAAQWEVARGLAYSGAEIARASHVRSDWFQAATMLFARYDALVLPTAQCWPFDVALDWPRQIDGHEMDTYHRWMEVVVPASLIGLPALAVPLPRDPQGRPMGLQIIGAPRDDLGVLQIGEAWHQAGGAA